MRIDTFLNIFYKGSSAVNKAKADMQKMDESSSQMGSSVSRNLGKVGLAVGAAVGALWGMSEAVRQTWETLGEGAALLTAQKNFENLSASFGINSVKLRRELDQLSGGMMSNAQEVALATQLMNLKLATSEESIARLTNVAGRLGWGMDEMTLTIANQSVKRLDALGLAIEDVVPKVKAFESAGMSASEAWALALTEAGEEKMALLGDVADTAEGKMKLLENAIVDIGDALKITFAESIHEQFLGGINGEEFTQMVKELSWLLSEGLSSGMQVLMNTIGLIKEAGMYTAAWADVLERLLKGEFKGGGFVEGFKGFMAELQQATQNTQVEINTAKIEQDAAKQAERIKDTYSKRMSGIAVQYGVELEGGVQFDKDNFQTMLEDISKAKGAMDVASQVIFSGTDDVQKILEAEIAMGRITSEQGKQIAAQVKTNELAEETAQAYLENEINAGQLAENLEWVNEEMDAILEGAISLEEVLSRVAEIQLPGTNFNSSAWRGDTAPNVLPDPNGPDPHMATGGGYTGFGPVIVGEEGIEMVIPPQSSEVIPNERVGMGDNYSFTIVVTPDNQADFVPAVQDAVLGAVQRIKGGF